LRKINNIEDPLIEDVVDGQQKISSVVDFDGKDENSGGGVDDDIGDDVTRIIPSNENIDMLYDDTDNTVVIRDDDNAVAIATTAATKDDDVTVMDRNVTSINIRMEAEEGEELE